MKKEYSILFVALVIAFMTVSILSVYADSSNSSNLTSDNTSSTHVTNGVMKSAAAQPMASSVSVTVDPSSVDLGSWDADGTQHTKSSAATVTISPNNGWTGSLYVRSSGDFVNSADSSSIIPLSNFQFRCGVVGLFGTTWGNIQTFSTTDSQIATYITLVFTRKCIMDYYISIPVGTEAGKYSTTVIYTAI